MRHPMLWTLLGLGAMVYLVAGAPLQGGEAPGTTPSMVVHPFDVQIDPLTNTSVHNREPVTYRVTIWNRSAFTQTGFLWFTVLCTGVDNEKPVHYPYIFEEMPFGGEISAWDEVELEFDAWPLANIPRGLYIYWAKIGRFQDVGGEINIDAMSTFHGTILDAPGADLAAPSADWVIGSVRAVNEAGKRFLAGGVHSARAVRLLQNYPNPFHPETWIAWEAAGEAGAGGDTPIRLDVYNVHGHRVRSLVNGRKPSGVYSTRWDGRDDRGVRVESGVYIFRLQSGRDVSLRKGILSR